MSRIVVVAVTALMLTGCTLPNSVSDTDQRDVISSITYRRDARTGVCFAMLSSSAYAAYRIVSISAVPSSACRQ